MYTCYLPTQDIETLFDDHEPIRKTHKTAKNQKQPRESKPRTKSHRKPSINWTAMSKE